MKSFECALCRQESELEPLHGRARLCPRHRAEMRAVWHLAGLERARARRLPAAQRLAEWVQRNPLPTTTSGN